MAKERQPASESKGMGNGHRNAHVLLCDTAEWRLC